MMLQNSWLLHEQIDFPICFWLKKTKAFLAHYFALFCIFLELDGLLLSLCFGMSFQGMEKEFFLESFILRLSKQLKKIDFKNNKLN
jgi:hypothetical protein